jgi:NAD(P)H-nitrite reductase large subunit
MRYSFDYTVCNCRNVTVGEIIYTIEQNNLQEVEEITKYTDAGSVCKCCVSQDKDYEKSKKLYLEQIIAMYKETK